MNNIYEYAMIAVIVYLFGSIPWGFILGKMKGIDIREHGSKNVGATNVNRVLGKKWALVCFLLDFLKGFIPVTIVTHLITVEILSKDAIYAVIIAAFAAFAGHVWTIYLGFKGGKGIATIAGIIVALAPLSFVISMVIWTIVFYSTRYVSLASIIASSVLPLSAYLLSKYEIYPLEDTVLGLLLLLAHLAVFKHKDNIKRLLKGTENRFEKKEKDLNK